MVKVGEVKLRVKLMMLLNINVQENVFRLSDSLSFYAYLNFKS